MGILANVEVEELLELVSVELEGGLVFGHACVRNEAIDATLGCDDGVDGCLDTGFDGHVRLEEEEV